MSDFLNDEAKSLDELIAKLSHEEAEGLLDFLMAMNYRQTSCLAKKDLPDGRQLHVTPLTFGRARLHITERWTHQIYSDEW